ncbi:hypothetical protein [Conexivisphaera calida]|uniref:hypothetical protein n=1 Tax=Conexivisphaera calida TaxID=1874277 RepID=UPI00157BAA04|nr:hypothetical protein [Conexivisphaera calida]
MSSGQVFAFALAVRCGSLDVAWPQGCTVQVVHCAAVPGLEFALEAAAQTYESRRRGVCVARRPDVDLLLRLMRTDRIEEALAKARARDPGDGCCIVVGYGDRACLDTASSLPQMSAPPVEPDIWRLAVEESALVGARPSPCERVLDAQQV